ncbi:MAG: plastocyanin [Chloroflexi bacterium]|nr:plastocyanin [Chloroflexota bacterium]
MKSRYLALAPALVFAVGACSGGASTPAASAPAATRSAVASPSAAVQRIEVKLTDALRMEPAGMTVKAGQSVTFVVTNAGAIQHEFFVGDQAAQDDHERVMASMGAMGMNEPDGIVLKPGETMELTHTFSTAGAFQAGCHESGHYTAGMKATITVTE